MKQPRARVWPISTLHSPGQWLSQETACDPHESSKIQPGSSAITARRKETISTADAKDIILATKSCHLESTWKWGQHEEHRNRWWGRGGRRKSDLDDFRWPVGPAMPEIILALDFPVACEPSWAGFLTLTAERILNEMTCLWSPSLCLVPETDAGVVLTRSLLRMRWRTCASCRSFI